MKAVFVDTLYWIAITDPHDQWHEACLGVRKKLGHVRMITTDEILVEYLNSFRRFGKQFRKIAADTTERILSDPNIRVIPQSRDSFRRALAFYADRPDKDYSLTDCVSMTAMKAESIEDVLTSDHHFAQEGFVVLIS